MITAIYEFISSLVEFVSSVMAFSISFIFIYLLPLLLPVVATALCIKRKRENKLIKKQVLFTCIAELILVISVFVFYRYVEESDFLLLVIFLLGLFCLLILLFIALLIFGIYRLNKKLRTKRADITQQKIE